MRQHKFRAKEAGGDWIYFSLIKNGLWDIPDTVIDLSTLGEYTGLKDKAGKEIYEGDILGYGDNYPCVVKYQIDGSGTGEGTGFYVEESGYEPDPPRTHELWYLTTLPEIIGNIYENPELLNHDQTP